MTIEALAAATNVSARSLLSTKNIDPALIDYVSTFVPQNSGDRFSPRVTTGVALNADLDQMSAEPFEAFSFSPAGVAVNQLGQFGMAAKKMRDLDLSHEIVESDGPCLVGLRPIRISRQPPSPSES